MIMITIKLPDGKSMEFDNNVLLGRKYATLTHSGQAT